MKPCFFHYNGGENGAFVFEEEGLELTQLPGRCEHIDIFYFTDRTSTTCF